MPAMTAAQKIGKTNGFKSQKKRRVTAPIMIKKGALLVR
jgi:hypothetical protein